jgi:cytochrome c oxidase assembly protein subunit 15
MTDSPTMPSPLAWLATRVVLTPRAARWATASALLASILIVVTGGVVRVTASGLGCPTWPACTTNSFTPTVDTGIHGAIEFTNRALTAVICAAVGWVVVAARLQPTQDRALLRSAWAQFWIVLLNAVIGGITVWTGLNPYIVAGHFLAAMLLLTATTISYDIAHRPPPAPGAPPRHPPPAVAWVTMLLTALLITVGTVVTGAGPHPGDSREVHRIPVEWLSVTRIHATLALVVLGVTIACVYLARRQGARAMYRRSLALLVILLVQIGVGVYQSVAGLPGAAVVVHLLGSALIWAGAVRLVLAGGGGPPRPAGLDGAGPAAVVAAPSTFRAGR